MNLENPEKIEKPKAWIRWVDSSREYKFHLDGYDNRRDIPDEIMEEIKVGLGSEWGVLNRGNRIEIFPPRDGKLHHEFLVLKLREALPDYEIGDIYGG